MDNNVTINLAEGKTLTESWLRMFGTAVSSILQAMFGGNTIPVTVRGTKQDVQAFSKVLASEKKYMQAYKQFGLDNPQTYKSRYRLNRAIRDFERKTGIIYPLK